MMKPNPIPSQEYLKRVFTYDFISGSLIRVMKNSKNNSRNGMGVAGCVSSKGYRIIKLDGNAYKAHRLIYAYHHGSCFDDMQIDHIDRNKQNNRIENLRLATNGQNQCNTVNAYKNSHSGVKGIRFNGSSYVARIALGGVRKCLGSFPTQELAFTAYQQAAQQHRGEFAPA